MKTHSKDILCEPPSPEEIRAIRGKLKLSQEQCATLAGLSGRNIWSLYESGAKKPTAQTWTAFCLATSTHPRYSLNDLHDLDFNKSMFTDLDAKIKEDEMLNLPVWFMHLIRNNDAFLYILEQSIQRRFVTEFNRLMDANVVLVPTVYQQVSTFERMIDQATGYNPEVKQVEELSGDDKILFKTQVDHQDFLFSANRRDFNRFLYFVFRLVYIPMFDKMMMGELDDQGEK
ncbi:helix-turn-helix domain-containing protein [Acinetobacter sp. P1(2025)]|uniref:helix-turn-helix domain-containing protein n=1 Tax=Acinetobacter sp. P1(2025) TaxID=3446120 RepID=UPI003F532735